MSRHHAALPRRAWARVRLAILDRDGWRCRACGRAGVLEVHHLQGLDEGGEALDPDNLQTLCRGCHIAHHRKAAGGPERRAWSAFLEERAQR